MNRGARALDNPRTKTGEESLEKLHIICEKLRQRDWETINNLKAKMVFLKRGGGGGLGDGQKICTVRQTVETDLGVSNKGQEF